MDIVLIRHGEAGERSSERWPDDDQRPLSEEGFTRQAASARGMKKLGIAFDFLVTSPLVRARQTADVVADAYGYGDEIQTSDALGHGCTPAAVVKLLARFPPDSAVALVGHEPSFSLVAAALVGRAGDASIALKKSGIIGISFDGAASLGGGTLSYHLKGGQLRKAAK